MSLEQPAQPQDDPPGERGQGRDDRPDPAGGAGAGGPARHVWTDAFREFDALYESSAEQRAARLAQLRQGDPAVAAALEGLLAEHDKQAAPDDPQATVRRDERWLMTLPPGGKAAAPLPVAMPDTIGPWRLLRELGQGGTARVFLARREDVPWMREVALKVPLMGVLREDLRERLVRERDILSRLEHPHIARLYDAGFAESQPWLAIEYVQGQTILQWCDARTAGLRERIALFRQVLQAVQYAHAALIVHRDLKPENILVTSEGSVRLLDFGIAKLLAEGASHTETTQLTHMAGRMLTPAYASPEQLRDEPLTTATDIYSLGVVLYELLTGVHPCAQGTRSLQQMERAITEGRLSLASRSPIRPEGAQARGLPLKVLRRELAGDLEAMLAKAMELEPGRRYETAAAFDADLEAWLDGRPVRARRPTMAQFAAKLVRRHPLASAASALAVSALAATTVVAVLQAREARVQAEQAQIEAARARSSKDFLLGLFDEADPDRNGGRDVLARDLLTRGEQRIERDLASQPQLRAEMLGAIGKVWWQFGDMDNAARVLQKRSEVAATGGSARGYAEALLDETQGAREAVNYTLATERLRLAQSVIAQVDEPAPRLSARASLEEGWIAAQHRGDMRGALAHLDRALRQARQAPASLQLQVDVLTAIAWTQRAQRNYEEATATIADAETIIEQERLRSADSFSVSQLHVLRLEKARVMYTAGRFRQGWPLMSRLMADVETTAGANQNRYALHQYRIWWFLWMVQIGLSESAEQWLLSHRADLADLPIADAVSSGQRHRWLAQMWIDRSNWSQAEAALSAGLREDSLEGTATKQYLLLTRALSYLRQAKPAEALGVLAQVEQARTAAARRELIAAEAATLRAFALAQQGDWAGASAAIERAEAGFLAEFGASHPRTAAAQVNRALIDFRWRRAMRMAEANRDDRPFASALDVLRLSYLPASPQLRLGESLWRMQSRRVDEARPSIHLEDRRLVDDLRNFLYIH